MIYISLEAVGLNYPFQFSLENVVMWDAKVS